MNKEPLIGLYPLNDCVLVELKQSSKNFTIKEGKYDTRTEGIVVAVNDKVVTKSDDQTHIEYPITLKLGEELHLDVSWLIGKRIHFEEFKEGARIKRNGKIYSFIKIEDIRGYEDEAKDS